MRWSHSLGRQAVPGCCLALAGCIDLAGCGGRNAPHAPSATPETPLPVVGYCQTGAESDWRVENTESFKSVFTEENGYELLFNNAQQKQENQLRAIRNFIQQQVDYIVFSPITENGWDSVLEEARDADIPVIITDRMVNVEDESLYTAFVGSDFRAEGKAAGSWLADYLQKQGRGEEPLRIVELRGTADSSAQLGRTEGLAEICAAHPNWQITAALDGAFISPKAREVVEAQCRADPDLDVLVCQNDNMALGAMEALDALGIPYGTQPGQVLILSFDATRAGLEACLAGKIAFDAECNPLQGPYVAEILRQIEAGKTPPKQTYVAETTFSYDTITRAVIDSRAY